MECMQPRIKDINFRSRIITARSGKGGKDRTVPIARYQKMTLLTK